MERDFMMIIKILNGPQYGETFSIGKKSVSIGRDLNNELILNDFKASRQHAEIYFKNNQYWIKDLKSSNGTFLNQESLKESLLKSGDIIKIGSTQLEFSPYENLHLISSGKEPEISFAGDAMTKIDLSLPLKKNLSELKTHFESDSDQLIANLSIIFQTSELIHKIIDENELIKKFSAMLFDVMDCDRLSILLKENEKDWTSIAHHRKNTKGKFFPLALSQSILKKVSDQKIGVLIRNTSLDDESSSQESIITLGIRSAMCAPLIIKDQLIGLIYIDVIHSQKLFNEFDLQLLISLTNQCSISMENCRLYLDLKNQEKMKNELKIAHDIQIHLLPELRHQSFNNIDLTFQCDSAEEIGGDYIDWFSLDQNKIAIVIADVSGKGIPGAMIMAMFKAMIRSLSTQHSNPKKLLENVNQSLIENIRLDMFVTCVYGIYDFDKNEFHFSRAGHLPVVIFSADGNQYRIEQPHGMALGMIPWNKNIELEERCIQLKKGETLMLYTDGLEEAVNKKNRELGRDQFYKLILDHYQSPIDTLIKQVYQSIQRYTGFQAQSDDMTMCLLRRL